ncbi:MAG: prolyl oligopeptidase family serine peptidase [Candidatus Aegiribacteria sp.]|nr:prolyl oligopeptidase family serine peptidase [Candidatus Aegiribacteria sp.]
MYVCKTAGSGYRLIEVILISLLIGVSVSIAESFQYPYTRIDDQVDDFFGTPVADPYRWLEDLDSEETLAWINAQNDLTFGYLETIPIREAIGIRYTELVDYQRYSMPLHRGPYNFFYLNDGLQEHSVYYCQDTLGGEPFVLIDPNLFPEEENLSLAGTTVSHDGKLIAWATSESGSDWRTWHVRDVTTGIDLDDTVMWSKMSGANWNSENTGFYYSRYDEPVECEEYDAVNHYHKLYFHELGTSQDQDVLIYERPDKPEWMINAGVTEDEHYLVIYIYDPNSVQKNGIFYIDLDSEDKQIIELLNDFDASYRPIGNIGEDFYFFTDLDAPNGRIISIDISEPSRENWRILVPEAEDILNRATILNDSSLVLTYTRDAYSLVQIYNLDGVFESEIELPCPGTAWGFGGLQSDTETFYTFSSFLYPGTIYRYDFETSESTLFWEPEINTDLAGYVTEQVFYESYDGTLIPMFLVYPEDIELDGSNPTLLQGYGGFNVSMAPWFRTEILVWLEMGGIFALPCIRGGGEYGEEWHLAGIKENRQNVYDDFICAAEYLITNGYTSTPKLAITGGSNGGTLVAACLNQRPDLYGAALPSMGVMDLLRFQLFTIGWAWTSEYGDPDDPDEFEFLYELSPYHNIEEGIEYPAVLVTTADHDDRVVPGHSFKYAARLQAAQAGDAPVLIRIQTSAGHGGSVGLSEAIQKLADKLAFLTEALSMDVDGVF